MNAYVQAMVHARAAGFYIPELECGWHRTAWDVFSSNVTPDNAVLAYHFDMGY
jgi:hypothetical protein